MRYAITGEWRKNTLLRWILIAYLGFVLLFWLSAGLAYFTKMSLSPDSVVAYFLGDVGQAFGRPPRPFASMVETSHYHLFAMGMLVMVLAHLLLFAPVRPRLKVALTGLAFSTTLANEASSWLVRFVHPQFALVKVASFVLMELSLLILWVVLFVYTIRPSRNAYGDTAG